jgi:hypothetical protein
MVSCPDASSTSTNLSVSSATPIPWTAAETTNTAFEAGRGRWRMPAQAVRRKPIRQRIGLTDDSISGSAIIARLL